LYRWQPSADANTSQNEGESVMFNRIFMLGVVLLFALVIALPASAQDECVGDPECYEPPSSGGSSNPQSNNPPPWSGLSDGRLNPDAAEYYSIYCKNTFLEIWRGVPTGSLLQFVPIWLLDGLNPDGGTTTIPNYGETPFTITRNGDIITVSGNFGNLQPAEGSKSFSLSDCIAHNDGPIGSAPPNNNPPAPQFSVTTLTVCYGRDSEAVRQGRVPPDQICDEGPTRMTFG
jgi:hypothetical protein